MTAAKILLVDDNPAHLKLALRALEQQQAQTEILTASNVREAKQQIESAQSGLRLAILDLKLGLESGTEILKCLRANTHLARVPVIMVSTSEMEDDVQCCYAAGADCYLFKSGDPEEYRSAVAAATRYCLMVSAGN